MACCFPFLSKRANRRIGVQTGPSPCILLILGTDGAGKTSLLMRLKGDPNTKTCTTWGFSTENILWQHQPVDPTSEQEAEESSQKKKSHVELRMYDVGGGQKIRGIWPNYYAECHGIIYVINAADTPERLQESAAELEKLRGDERLIGKPILILLNKYELRDACPLVKMCLSYPLLPEQQATQNQSKQPLDNSPTLSASKSKSNLSNINLNDSSQLSRERKRVARLPVLTSIYLHSSLLRIQASCCLISPTTMPSHYTPSSPLIPPSDTLSSPYRIAMDTSSSPTISSPTSLSMKLQGAPTLADGINWLISAIQLQWETSDMSSKIEYHKAQQEKRYEQERELQRKRVEEWKREKEKKEINSTPQPPVTSSMQTRSWSTSHMPAGVWGGIPPTETHGHVRRETSPLTDTSHSDTPKPIDLPPPLPLLSPTHTTPSSRSDAPLNPIRTAKTLPPLGQRGNKVLPPLNIAGGLPPITVGGGGRGRTIP